MQILGQVVLFFFAVWCVTEAGISVWVIATWDRPYHGDQFNQMHRAMSRRDHRKFKLMHARHALGWLIAGGVTAGLASGRLAAIF